MERGSDCNDIDDDDDNCCDENNTDDYEFVQDEEIFFWQRHRLRSDHSFQEITFIETDLRNTIYVTPLLLLNLSWSF